MMTTSLFDSEIYRELLRDDAAADLFDDAAELRAMIRVEVALAKVQGEFVWHHHADTDEVFIVIDGILEIEFREGKVTLEAGEMFVVPKGVEHKPSAEKECQIMLVEPKGVINTGDTEGTLTAQNDVWV